MSFSQGNTPWAAYKDIVPECGSFQVRDWSCDQFEALIIANSNPQAIHAQSRFLFECIDSKWESDFSRCVVPEFYQ